MRQCAGGHDNDEYAKFCSTCGTPLTPAAEVTPGPPPMPTVTADVAADGGAARRKIPLKVLLSAGVVVAVVIAAVTFGAGSDSKQQIRGTFTLLDSDVSGTATDCSGTGGYSDFEAGMAVTVRDKEGSIVGGSSTRQPESLTELAERFADSASKADIATARDLLQHGEGVFCVLLFDVEVDNATFYEVKVGHRGELAYSHKEMAAHDWKVALSLGS